MFGKCLFAREAAEAINRSMKDRNLEHIANVVSPKRLIIKDASVAVKWKITQVMRQKLNFKLERCIFSFLCETRVQQQNKSVKHKKNFIIAYYYCMFEMSYFHEG